MRGGYHNPLTLPNANKYTPRILSPELWSVIIPQGIREGVRKVVNDSGKKVNPATYFIWIYILIGSQAIRILQLKIEARDYMRRAELQINKLREVVRRLQNGEQVDVEGILGTGIPDEEEAWDQALQQIEDEDRIWQDKQRIKREKEERRLAEQAEADARRLDASPISDPVKMSSMDTGQVKVPPKGPVFF